MLEIGWAPCSRHEFDKAPVLGAFNALLETQDEAPLKRAPSFCRYNRAGYADCAHSGQRGSVHRATIISLDRPAARLPGVELPNT